jgi:DNA topoisomerase-3
MRDLLPGLIDDTAEFLKIEPVQNPDIARIISDSKISDHHAVIPTHTMTAADLSGLSENQIKILNMIALRLICSVSENHVYNETSVTIECEQNIFTAKGRTIINNGWKSLIKKDGEISEKSLPELSKGQGFTGVSAKLNEGFTSPPKPFTEDTLLSAMENAGDFSEIPNAERKGLGTPATRSDVIERLVEKGFVRRVNAEDKKVRHLQPTEKGVNLIKILPDAIKSAELTAEWEHKLEKIKKGGMSDADFMNEIAVFIGDVIKSNSTANPEYTGLFSSVSQYAAVGNCPKCGGIVRDSYNTFVCENRDCTFKIFKRDSFFAAAKKELTAEIVSEILKNGRVKVDGLYSKKKNRLYGAVLVLKDTGGEFMKFDFEKKNKM